MLRRKDGIKIEFRSTTESVHGEYVTELHHGCAEADPREDRARHMAALSSSY